MYIALAYSYPPENGAMRPLIYSIMSAIPDSGYIITSNGVIYKTEQKETYILRWKRTNPYTRISTTIKQRLGINIYPDILQYWSNAAYKVAIRIIKEVSINSVISFSYPHSAHICASKLANKYHMKWYAYIADPLVNGLLYEKSRVGMRKSISKLESKILREAAVTIVNSRMYYEQINCRGNVAHIVHSYSNIYDKCQIGQVGKEVAHFGNVYGDRSIITWVYAIEQLNRKDIKHSNYGSIKEEEKSIANSVHVQQYSAMEYEKYIKKTMECMGLIVMCGNSLGSRNSFPSKVVDYIGSCRPILVFAPEKSSIAGICDGGQITLCSNECSYEATAKVYTDFIDRALNGKVLVDYEKRKKMSEEAVKQKIVELYDH